MTLVKQFEVYRFPVGVFDPTTLIEVVGPLGTPRPKLNGPHFADNVFKNHNDSYWIKCIWKFDLKIEDHIVQV